MSDPVKKTIDPRTLVLDLVTSKGLPTRRFPDAAVNAGLGTQDRALARAMLAGVIRRRRTLDSIFKPFCSRRVVDPIILWTLRLALYQRFFLEGVPVYAAFHATLEAAKPRMRRGLGFANAVLRAVEKATSQEKECVSDPAEDRLTVGGRSWRFQRAVFPDPVHAQQEYWAKALSYPDLLVQRWFDAVGPDQALHRMRSFNETPPLALRVNPLRSSVEEVQAGLLTAGIEAEARGGNALLVTQPTGDIRRLPGFEEGKWSVQDLAAQQAIQLAAPAAGERILDCCAAPGGKSFAAYELAGGNAEVVACDLSVGRLKRLETDRERLGHKVSTFIAEAGTSPEQKAGTWDLIILDVPCSNTAVLGRRPEARWHFSEEELRRCIQVQKRITQAVLPTLLHSGTRVLWATCSLEPEENLKAAERAARRSGLQVSEVITLEPDEERSGAFAALLVPGP